MATANKNNSRAGLPEKRKGKVSIEEKAGKYRVRLPRTVADGASRYISTRLDATPTNKRLVQRVVLEMEDDLATGAFDATLDKYKARFAKDDRQTFVNTSPVVVSPAVSLPELWSLYCEYRKSQVAVTTFKMSYLVRYTNHISRLPSHKLEDALTIRDYIVSKLSPDVAKLLLTQLNACCKWSVRSKLIPVNPFSNMALELKLPKRCRDIHPFSVDERDAIIAAYAAHPVHKHYLNFVRFLFLTGCRLGEAVALRWEHISSDYSYIIFSETYNSQYKVRKDTKTHTSRRFPCNAVLRELLLSLPRTGNDVCVFTSVNGGIIHNEKFTTRGGWRNIVEQLVRDGVVSTYRRPYNARHTFITMALEGGLTVSQVAALVGNSPTVILQHYAGNTIKVDVPVF